MTDRFSLCARRLSSRSMLVCGLVLSLMCAPGPAQAKRFGSFSSPTRSSSTSAAAPRPAAPTQAQPAKPANATTFGSFGAANKPAPAAASPNSAPMMSAAAPAAAVAVGAAAVGVAAVPKPAPSALNADLGSNAAKANALNAYDARSGGAKAAEAGGGFSANTSATTSANPAYGASPPRASYPGDVRAPATTLNNNSSSSSSGSSFGGLGSGLFSGLLLGSIFSSHSGAAAQPAAPSQSGQHGQLVDASAGTAHQGWAERGAVAPTDKPWSWLGRLMLVVLVGGAGVAVAWFVFYKAERLQRTSAATGAARRYTL